MTICSRCGADESGYRWPNCADIVKLLPAGTRTEDADRFMAKAHEVLCNTYWPDEEIALCTDCASEMECYE